jgi:2-dehydro-3-deoxygluconokinase
MHRLISLGEMLLRLSPPKFERLCQSSQLDIHPCGAQFNIAADFSILGGASTFLTRFPNNELGYLGRSLGQRYGVDMSHARLVDNPKIGMVFLEFSVPPRRQIHLYDRKGSAAAATELSDFELDQLLPGTTYAYTDGIFPALGDKTESTVLTFLQLAKTAGCLTCFDVNYRESLWAPEQALDFYRKALPLIDILVTNRNISEEYLATRGR